MEIDTRHEIDKLVAHIDEKYTRWKIWRTATQYWHFWGYDWGQEYEENNISLHGVLSNASQWQPLPVVPRKPTQYFRQCFSFRKNGSQWRVYYKGAYIYVSCKTRRAAENYADMLAESSERRVMEWQGKYYLMVSGKTEGVDFRWGHE